MPNLSDLIANATIDHQLDLLRVAAGANRQVQALLRKLEDDIVARLARSNGSATARARLAAALRDVRLLIAEGYGAIDSTMDAQFIGLIATEASITAAQVNESVGISLMSGTLPKIMLKELLRSTLIMGAPSSEWWLRQAQDLTFRFVNEMRLGVAQNETNAQLVSRIRALPGIWQQPRRAAEALVRTSVQTVANSARLATFKENSSVLKGYQQVSTLDNRTTDICIAYDGAAWDLDGKPLQGTTLPFVNPGGSPHGIPRHWGCRSSLIPVTKSWRELGIDADEFTPSMRASADGEVAAKLTYADWLARMSAEQQDQVLGAGKAQLWRAGKITARDLLDQGGRPMTLDQIRSKHGLD